MGIRPGSSYLLGVLWPASTHLSITYAKWLDNQPSLCPLKRFTGNACPLCGGTRSALFLLGGDVVSSLRLNAGVALTAAFFTYLLFSRERRLQYPAFCQ